MLVVPISERTSGLYTATLKDEAGNVVPGSTLETLTLSLYESTGGAIVNGRKVQNVLNTNNVAIDSSGGLTWQIQPADTEIVNNQLAVEPHIAEFQATWAGGTKGVTWKMELDVANLATIH